MSGWVQFVTAIAVHTGLLIYGPTAHAQCEISVLTVDVPDVGGHSIAVDGAVAVLGAGWGPGEGVVFRRGVQGWTREQTLVPTDGNGVRFGASVAIDGDVIVVGDPFAGPMASAGAADVYRFAGNSWEMEARLTPTDLDFDDLFGSSVAIDEDVIVVGAIRDDDGGTDAGAVYTFRFDDESWRQEQKLVAFDVRPNDRFGVGVAVDGDTLIVGADFHDVAGPASGAVFPFEFDGVRWNEGMTIVASDATAGDRFGLAVATSGGVTFVGAFGHDAGEVSSGTAYVFERSNGVWDEVQQILPSTPLAGGAFGISVAVRNDFAVVGADRFDGLAGSTGGAIQVLYRSGGLWEEGFVFESPPSPNGGFSGHPVAIGDAHVLGGSDGGSLFSSAAMHVFDVTASDCNQNATCDQRELSGYAFRTDSFVHQPFGFGEPLVLEFAGLPKASGNVNIVLSAVADLDGTFESVDVFLNDRLLGTTFSLGAHSCPPEPDRETLSVAASLFNELHSEVMELTLLPSIMIESTLCGDRTGVGVSVEYEAHEAVDCNMNESLDECDIANGVSLDSNDDAIPDECAVCKRNADCDDGDSCIFNECVDSRCFSYTAAFADVVGPGNMCGPDGIVDIFDLFAVIEGFQDIFHGGCDVTNVDLAGPQGQCIPDGILDVLDIFAVVDTFQGMDTCCLAAVDVEKRRRDNEHRPLK